MKVCPIILLCMLIHSVVIAQRPLEKDSLLHALQKANHDSTRIRTLFRLSHIEQDKEKELQYLNQGYKLALKSTWGKGKVLSYFQFGHYFLGNSDFTKALEYYLKTLKIMEKLGTEDEIANVYTNIGNVYRHQENPRAALQYFFKAEKLYGTSNSPHRMNLYNLMGISYMLLKQSDSALIYFNRGYEFSNHNPLYMSRILRGLANVHASRGDVELAFSFNRKSLEVGKSSGNIAESAQTHLQLSALFTQTGQRDSALHHAEQAMRISKESNFLPLFARATKQLSSLYENLNDKEALRYYKLSADTKDSIFSADNLAKMQNLTFDEVQRQREADALKEKEKEIRSHNLQYAAITIGIISLIVLFFLLSHSIVANPSVIRFFGVMALLIVFEFLNLFLHPYLGTITHHSPILMLLFMVCVAALLVPLHHKLEHWITHKMVEKNNRIRLAAAKRTIQALEGTSGEVVQDINSNMHQ